MPKPRYSSDKRVHRNLHLVSPVLKGEDVEALQRTLNEICDHFKFPWRKVIVDGEYGRRTQRAAKFCAWLIGLNGARQRIIGGKRGVISEEVQRLFRNPKKRTRAMRLRVKARKRKRVKLHQQRNQGAQAAVDWAKQQVGTKESPPGSNRGPGINVWEAFFGLGAVPWCGCFAGYAVKAIGKAQTDTWFPYAGSIRQDAIAGNNNLHDVNPSQAEPGDIVTFFSGGDDHIGLITAVSRDGLVITCEGNTSSAVRDSDGGIVENKERSFGEVTCVARIEKWG